MQKIKIIILSNFILFFILILYVHAQNISDYLILNDIGNYKKLFDGTRGVGSGTIARAEHFDLDHDDITYRISYSNGYWVDVQVTKHSGGESDRWLLHEMEDIYRRNDMMGELLEGTRIRKIEGNNILNWITYIWLSGNTVVYISWIPEPNIDNVEPLNVVKAYLAKYPSTLTITDNELKSKKHNEKWIKEEMERRLWLYDKWILYYQSGKVTLKEVLRESFDHMKVFLDYRKKYYGVSATDDRKALYGYLQDKDIKAINNKLTEYKKWWSTHKDKPINFK